MAAVHRLSASAQLAVFACLAQVALAAPALGQFSEVFRLGPANTSQRLEVEAALAILNNPHTFENELAALRVVTGNSPLGEFLPPPEAIDFVRRRRLRYATAAARSYALTNYVARGSHPADILSVLQDALNDPDAKVREQVVYHFDEFVGSLNHGDNITGPWSAAVKAHVIKHREFYHTQAAIVLISAALVEEDAKVADGLWRLLHTPVYVSNNIAPTPESTRYLERVLARRALTDGQRAELNDVRAAWRSNKKRGLSGPDDETE